MRHAASEPQFQPEDPGGEFTECAANTTMFPHSQSFTYGMCIIQAPEVWTLQHPPLPLSDFFVMIISPIICVFPIYPIPISIYYVIFSCFL